MKRVLLLMIATTVPVWGSEVVQDPLEQQVLEIAAQLRCTVCQNQPVSESNADLARDMRAIIREQLQAGRSHDEIMEYFVERYGNYVLLNPPFDHAGAAVWLLPPIVLLAIAAFAIAFVRRRLKQPLPPPRELSDEDIARIRGAREQDEK